MKIENWVVREHAEGVPAVDHDQTAYHGIDAIPDACDSPYRGSAANRGKVLVEL
ncbi:hypothetical protein [Saccharopolyspora gregorii]|uniref:hypothetical protein n=1 Tax=Saccharopolyspora gregorii TaxID=33914 RepID=UPI0021ACF7BA|nr:hypothetical protein [Saccharopolyspora gregorii]